MNRRNFLRKIAACAGAVLFAPMTAIADTERWKPGTVQLVDHRVHLKLHELADTGYMNEIWLPPAK